MNTDANLPADVFDGVPFDEFYDRALPVVYGYLLRLCGGDADEAWDLTQDSWMVVARPAGTGAGREGDDRVPALGGALALSRRVAPPATAATQAAAGVGRVPRT